MPTLRDIFGQPHALAVLAAAMRSGRLHHAWIFHGPDGVGKRTAAEAFAAALLDPSTREREGGFFEPDPDTDTQRLAAAGTHPDLRVITKELARFHDDKQIRDRKLMSIPKEVIEQHLLAPAALSRSQRHDSIASRVFIVDEAELLNTQTQNLVLKTLEEPAAGVVIILVTSAEDRLLPTIRSRCQRVAFASLPEDAMQAWMRRERVELDTNAGWALAYAAGSPGRLRMAIDHGLLSWADTLEPMLAAAERGRFHPDMGAALASLVDDWARRWVDEHENASKEAANKAGGARMLGMLAERARLALRAAAQTGDDPGPALRAIDLIEEARVRIEANVAYKFAFEDLAAQLAAG